eukprot:Hpha_TRINITY_DN16076_c0_g8::TRINITY_DN16076_c0_g8_i1::g.119093::m.119093
MRAVSLLAAALGATASGLVSEHEGGVHPDVSLHGFQINSIFFHQEKEGAAPLRRHVMQRRASAEQIYDTTMGVVDKDLVQALAKLNFLAYPGDSAHRTAYYDSFYPSGSVDAIFSGSNSILGGTTRDAWIANAAALWTSIAAEAAIANISNATNIYNPNRTVVGATNNTGGAYDRLGVAALEFKRGGQSLLVFRGTYTQHDVMNQRNHILEWVTQKMEGKMKTAFVQDGGYTWTSTQENRMANQSTRVKYWCGSRASGGLFGTPLQAFGLMGVELALSTNSAPLGAALKWGYWEIVKAITNTVADGVNATYFPQRLVLSGHAQGGGHAALASMYLRKSRGVDVQAVTFAANTGDACSAMHLSLSLENLKHDVDPFVFHPQLIDYTHALDPLGNAQGIYPGTRRFLQKRGDTTDLGYTYCEPLAGELPLQLLYDNTRQLVRCLAVTHSIDRIYEYTQMAGALHEDGSTWGGANSRRDNAPTEGDCPSETSDYGDCGDDDHDWWIIGVSIGSVAAALTVVIAVVWCVSPHTIENLCSKRKDIDVIMEEEEAACAAQKEAALSPSEDEAGKAEV